MDRAVEEPRLWRRMVGQTLAWLAVMGAILFVAAGDWRWPQGWAFLAEIGASSFAVNLWLLRHDPALLASRLAAPVQPDQQRWDRALMAVLMAGFVAWIALMGLDARRWRWSAVPVAGQALGAVLVALCMVACWQVFRFNTFAAPQVRMQRGRAQRVITDGPYRVVRHPMYAGASLLFVGAPLLLGSCYGLLAAPLFMLAVGGRIVGEERMLQRELAGYAEYARRVRYRLVPGVW